MSELNQYDNNNRFVLFKNERKEKDSHPDFTGTGMADNKEYYIKGWKKQSKKGTPYISIAIDLKTETEPKKPSPVDVNASDPF